MNEDLGDFSFEPKSTIQANADGSISALHWREGRLRFLFQDTVYELRHGLPVEAQRDPVPLVERM